MSGADRRRKRDIRERMARTGDTYARTARLYDEERARDTAFTDGFDAQPGTETPTVTRPEAALSLPFVAPPDQPE